MTLQGEWLAHVRRGAQRSRTVAIFGIALAGAILAQCNEQLLAPSGSKATLTVNPDQVATGGDTAVLTALILEGDGYPVDDNTVVLFTASPGGLCSATGDNCAPGSAPGIWSATTKEGIAVVRFVSGDIGTTATVSARSGGAPEVSTTITVSSRAAPNGAKAVLVADPDTIAVGASSRIRAYVYDANGTPVVDGTRVAFVARDSVRVRKGIALTDRGFAETDVTGLAAGARYVLVHSGSLRDSVQVVIQ